ncbi:MAG: peptide-methionine (S)-S-oxide reductase MsrA [bacterium]|nr:peptide-methionine (S)-S-oxide reductase MsrA [bacterium]
MEKKIVKATFGLGCFWEPDVSFSKLPGVLETVVGYSGGDMPNPSYENVCGGDTGHTEVVEVHYDPLVISYEKLLEHFWEAHSPVLQEKTQYRSVIFYHNDEQKKAAEKSKEAVEKKLGKKVLTKILSAEPFWRAEEYHQKYLTKISKS